jgi:hypothetical protein
MHQMRETPPLPPLAFLANDLRAAFFLETKFLHCAMLMPIFIMQINLVATPNFLFLRIPLVLVQTNLQILFYF